nr:hypothetical protein [Bacillus wiedmannii]
MSKVINSYKSVSSRFVKRDFPKIKHYLRKEIILMNSLRKVVKKWLERKQ